ncbi:MAG: hypothetical protein J5742_01255 [Alphaproteobacteria bacterium]|nr:hypothetical protein [Alphaproteobacteria bacterium]
MPKKQKPINILFAATSDYLPYAIVTARSAIERANGRPVNIHFMYADIVKPIPDQVRECCFEMARRSLDDVDATINFYDISDKMFLLEGQNVGMWGQAISMTHYFYLLSPLVLPKDVDKVIYLDTDMIVNCDLGVAYDTKMSSHLIAMGAPRGVEEMGDDVSNSGFSVLNLKMWRAENTLDTLLAFGRALPRARFCDQYLLHEYFKKNHVDRMMFLAPEYNLFPQCAMHVALQDIKILHFTGYGAFKPWQDVCGRQRGAHLWWRSARHTEFYEKFIMDMVAVGYKSKSQHHSFWWHLVRMKF